MTATAGPQPPAVPRFEYNLLRLLRFLLGHMPAEQAAVLVSARLPAPPCLSRTCVRLAQDTLAKGLVLHLVQSGGWRDDRHLRGGRPVGGRVWERLSLDVRRLDFSEHPLRFLIWLAAERVVDTKEPWDAPLNELTPGDELFFATAFDALGQIPEAAPVVAAKTAFRRNPLCWLYAPSAFAGDEPVPPDFTPSMSGTRAAILECLQHALVRRWLHSERTKGQIGDWKTMRQQGRAEFSALSAFLSAAHAAGRPDLARFVLRAASALLLAPGELTPAFWTGGLQGHGPQRLADRLDTQRAALALPRLFDVLQGWDRKARVVGYFDEGYAASQLWKADWEAVRGDDAAVRARQVLDRLEPLRT